MSAGSHDALRRRLGTLAELQQLQVERQQARLVAEQQLCRRVQGTVDRLEALGAQATLSGVTMPGLMQNSAAYKQAMLAWADQQRAELARREAELALARADALAAARKQQSLQLLVGRADARARAESARREQRGQDELATLKSARDAAAALKSGRETVALHRGSLNPGPCGGARHGD